MQLKNTPFYKCCGTENILAVSTINSNTFYSHTLFFEDDKIKRENYGNLHPLNSQWLWEPGKNSDACYSHKPNGLGIKTLSLCSKHIMQEFGK